MTRPHRLVGLLLGAVLIASACASSEPASDASPESPSGDPTTTAGPPTATPDETGDPDCALTDDRTCLLPFPNDQFVVNDDTTDTGSRIRFPTDAMPVNVEGTPIDPAEWNRSDGFSPGSMLLTQVDDLDTDASGLPPITDIGASLDDDSPLIVWNATSGERHPVWAELDANAADPDSQLLIIRPAINFLEGNRYVVGLRNLVGTDGEPIEANEVFASYRDEAETADEAIEAQRDPHEAIFDDLDAAGVERDDLILAWDFTVASQRSLSERLLSMRDESFASLDGAAPEFTVEEVTGDPEAGRKVTGRFDVPNWMTGSGEPGTTLNNADNPDGIPEINGTYSATFTCMVPSTRTADDGTIDPAGASLYGHGLLGAQGEVEAVGALFGGLTNTVFCATDWIGMSSGDLLNVGGVLTDLSDFRSIPDRLQQAHLNFLFLGRLLADPGGFASDPAFQSAGAESQLSGELVFVGNSQGGILGGATTAVAQDWERAVLGVPAMNYSTLLRRSIDFDEFLPLFEDAYPDEADQTLALALMQMLWDRGENNGYAQHITTDPYADTPAKQVWLFEAFGDHQVANIATETLARTVGALIRQPALADGRSTAVEPFWGLEPAGESSESASYLVMWDFGTPAPPIQNIPPTEGDDPHGAGAEEIGVLQMAAAFLFDRELLEVCDDEPCRDD